MVLLLLFLQILRPARRGSASSGRFSVPANEVILGKKKFPKPLEWVSGDGASDSSVIVRQEFLQYFLPYQSVVTHVEIKPAVVRKVSYGPTQVFVELFDSSDQIIHASSEWIDEPVSADGPGAFLVRFDPPLRADSIIVHFRSTRQQTSPLPASTSSMTLSTGASATRSPRISPILQRKTEIGAGNVIAVESVSVFGVTRDSAGLAYSLPLLPFIEYAEPQLLQQLDPAALLNAEFSIPGMLNPKLLFQAVSAAAMSTVLVKALEIGSGKLIWTKRIAAFNISTQSHCLLCLPALAPCRRRRLRQFLFLLVRKGASHVMSSLTTHYLVNCSLSVAQQVHCVLQEFGAATRTCAKVPGAGKKLAVTSFRSFGANGSIDR